MFSNIGGKIKALAKVLCILGVLGAIIYGSAFISISKKYLQGFLIIALGSLFSWISSFCLYGFGELVDNSTILKDYVTEQKNALKRYEKSNSSAGISAEKKAEIINQGGWTCECGRVNYPYITTCSCGRSKWEIS